MNLSSNSTDRHSHTSSIMQYRNFRTLTTSFKDSSPIHIFLSGFVALLDCQPGLYLPTEHNSCRIHAWSTTHVIRACMFNRVQYNHVTSHCHLGSQQHNPCIMIPSHISKKHQPSRFAWTHLLGIDPRVDHFIGTSRTSIHPGALEYQTLPCPCYETIYDIRFR